MSQIQQMPNREAKGAPKGSRKPKQGNSELFNELFSAANALSVSERTRLVKSLAGQLNLSVIGTGELLSRGSTPAEQKVKAAPPPKEAVRPNPLKGTRFEADKRLAYQALIAAKEAAQGAKLPEDHPVVVHYKTTLDAYKAEQGRLRLVDPVAMQRPQTQPKAKVKARSASERSPSPVAPVRGLVGRIQGLVGRASSSKNQKVQGAMEVDEDIQ